VTESIVLVLVVVLVLVLGRSVRKFEDEFEDEDEDADEDESEDEDDWRRNVKPVTTIGSAVLGTLTLAALISAGTVSNGAEGAQETNAMPKSTCEFGLEGGAPRDAESLAIYLKAVRDLGAEFIVCQFGPERNDAGRGRRWEASEQGLADFSAACRAAHLTFFANQEVTNYTKEGDILDKDGKDVLAHPDGTHRWDITGRTLEIAVQHPEFRGVLYDEAEHGQMRRGNNTNGGSDDRSTDRVHPYFAATDGMTLEQAYNAVCSSARAVAENYRRAGVTPMSEHVFPVMFHTFARAGFDPATKFLKEGIDPVFAAIAMGAAREYGREFCVTPDLWGLSGFPGHPPEELRCSLLYAYWIGARRIFVENIRGLIERKEENGVVRYETTAYGKVYEWFVKEYVPAHPRPYTFLDIRPEVAIVRFDDSCWGQADSWLPDALYGAANLKSTPATAAWFQIWSLLTHGQTREGGLSFHNHSYNGLPHDFFCPLRGAVMYDHLAGAKELAGLKLVFLTGVQISPQTMDAVRDFVRKGGLCVTLDSLAPGEMSGRSGPVADGSGEWLIVKDFRGEEVRKAVAPFLGKPDEIRYQVGERRLTVKRGKDSNTIRIYLQEEKDIQEDAEPAELARVW
jgi:hypothetical protein